MQIVHLLVAMFGPLQAIALTQAQWSSALSAVGVHAGHFALGAMASVLLQAIPSVAALTRHAGQRLIRGAVAAGSQAGARSLRSGVDQASGPSGPQRDEVLPQHWTCESGAWPDEIPEALRLRLLDALSYSAVRTDDVWDELKGWLIQQGLDGPPTRTGARRSSTKSCVGDARGSGPPSP